MVDEARSKEYKTGDVVDIYYDPTKETALEGRAMLVSKTESHISDGRIYQTWTIRFMDTDGILSDTIDTRLLLIG